MIKISTGLASAILGDYGLSRMMNRGIIDIYSGSQPEYAHFAPTGTWLGRITTDGLVFTPGSPANGLMLDRSESGVLKDSGDWMLKGVATGEAGWWRWKWYQHDPNTTDPYYPRIDGSVGDSLVLLDRTITPSTAILINQFYLTFGE